VRQDADFLTALRKLPSVYDWHAQPGPQPEHNSSICSASMKLTSRSVPEFLPPPPINFLTEKPSPSVRRVLSITLFYTRVGLCSELPSIRDRDFPLLSKYDSMESCSDSIRTDRYSDWGELPDANPIFFPTLESFQSALDEVGYRPRSEPGNDAQANI
jgi:hypothetical protein